MALIVVEILILAAIILLLYHLRSYLGLSLVYVFCGAIQYFQTLLISTVHVDLFGKYPVSPGSAALFSATLFALLLVYLREGVPRTRRLIYGVLLANFSLLLLTLITRFGLNTGSFVSHSDYVRAFSDFDAFAFVFGAVLLLVDALLLVFVYEALSLNFRALPLLVRIVVSLVLVLAFDSFVFMTASFERTPDFSATLIGNLCGKVISGVLYGFILWGYLSVFPLVQTRAADFAPRDMTDVFSIVTYRERYMALQDQAAKKEKAHAEERMEVREELRKAQDELRQAQKLESIGRLAGGIAHDFNNILTAILGYSDLIAETPDLPETTGRFAEQINIAAKRAADLTHQLLAFSRKQVLSPQILDVNKLIDSGSDMLGRLIGERVQLTLDLGEDIPSVCADSAQLQQVILNLAINARDAMTDGGTLRIETRRRQLPDGTAILYGRLGPGSYVDISVIDSGTGIDEETQQRIFEPFFTTKDQGKGTGLGLSTVYGVVEQSGGWVYVESKVHEGSTFHVLLPAAASEPEETSAVQSSPRIQFSGRILVVEDDPVVATLTSELLKDEGFEVIVANDGATALQLVSEQGPIDLLLTDVVLPGMDGLEVAARIAEKDPEVAVIFVTGYIDEEVASRNPQMTLLQKPFDPQEFLDIVYRTIQDRIQNPGKAASADNEHGID